MKIFDFKNYKKYLSHYIENQPKGGRGQIKKMADHLNSSTTLVSQVLRGDKNFSLETAAELTDYLGLNEKESQYFINLVEIERAGSFKLKRLLAKKLEKEQLEELQLKNRLPSDRQFNNDEKMQFYSSWIYSGIRILSALPEAKNAKAISSALNLPLTQTNEAIKFLLNTGLCVEKSGRLTYGPQRTHIGHDSPFVNKHHQNWRIKAFHAMEKKTDKNLHFTQPMAMSVEAAEKIRVLLPEFIESILNISTPSESEVVRCLNIDWFDYI